MNNIIEIVGLTKIFGDFIAVDNISFSIQKAEIIGLLGANGAGKTTTIRMLCGLLKPTKGSATIAGFDLYRDADKIKHIIGYMSQKFSLYTDLTVFENIKFYAGIYDLPYSQIKTKADEILEELGIMQWKNALIKSLPIGWKQKIAFSIAIMHKPQIVFLDEPTSGVDPLTRRLFWEMIYKAAQNGTTVILSTHYLDEAENCNRVIIMDKGKIVANDTPSNLKNNFSSKTMNDVFIKLCKSQYYD